MAGSLRSFHESHGEMTFLVFSFFHAAIADELHRLNYNQDKRPVCADATNLTADAREKLRLIGRHNDADVHLTVFADYEGAVERNQNRDEDAVVPAEVMVKMQQQFETFMEGLDTERSKYASVTVIDSIYVHDQSNTKFVDSFEELPKEADRNPLWTPCSSADTN